MAQRTHEVLYNLTGQTVSVYPAIEYDPSGAPIIGVPSSATCSVFVGDKSADDSAEFSPAVTVDAVSTTFDSASGSSQTNKRRCYVAATTGIDPGVLYLIENQNEQREIVRPFLVKSADHVDVEQDLAFDYPSTSDTFKGLKMTVTVDATWIATENKISTLAAPSYRVVWSYTLQGAARKHTTYLRMVRKLFRSGVQPEDLFERWPGLYHDEEREIRGQRFRSMINAAEDAVRADLISEGYRPEQFHDTEIIGELVVIKAFHRLGQMGKAPPGMDAEPFREDMAKAYGQLFAKSISTLKVALDVGSEGSAVQKPVQQVWFAS